MAISQNSPFGLRPVGHLQGGASNISFSRSSYVIDQVVGTTLNKGDPVIIQSSVASTASTSYFKRGETVITRYNPTVNFQAAGTATTFTDNKPIVGVFMGCKYKDSSGMFVEQEYWVTGTTTTSKVEAIVYDDPDIIWEVQLSTYLGAAGADTTKFVVLPCMQTQDGSWPNTGIVGSNLTVDNSALIGTNIMLLTGKGPAVGSAGGSASMSTIQRWDGTAAVVAGYNDNPLIANYGTTNSPRNQWGVSTYYGCPSIAATSATPSVNSGSNEYARDASAPFKVLGFSKDPNNIPDIYGQPATGISGTYFNTPFLNVFGIINNHAYRPGYVSVTPAA